MTDIDLVAAAAPRSDQINADDLIGGPQIVTITEVRPGNSEQPVEIVTAEFGPARPYKPGKSMIRVLIEAWGAKSQPYVGRKLMLYRDPEITFGKDRVGGIRISAMSDLDGPKLIALTKTRGKRAPFRVEPLKEQPAPSKIPVSFDAKIPTSTLEQCVQARDYLAKYADTEPERVAALLDKVTARESQLAQEVTE